MLNVFDVYKIEGKVELLRINNHFKYRLIYLFTYFSSSSSYGQKENIFFLLVFGLHFNLLLSLYFIAGTAPRLGPKNRCPIHRHQIHRCPKNLIDK